MRLPALQEPRIRRPSARYAQLVRMCRRRGCSREDALELVQQAHLHFLEYAQTTKIRDVNSLLRRIVINLSITHHYRGQRPAFQSVYRLDRRGLLTDPAPSPERMAAAEQQLDAVVNLLDARSPRTAQIFIAHRGGYTYEEIATAFFVRERTIEKHVSAGADLLAEHGAAFISGASLTGPPRVPGSPRETSRRLRTHRSFER